MCQMLEAARSMVVVTRGMRAPRCNRRGPTPHKLSNFSRNIARRVDADPRCRGQAGGLGLSWRRCFTIDVINVPLLFVSPARERAQL